MSKAREILEKIKDFKALIESKSINDITTLDDLKNIDYNNLTILNKIVKCQEVESMISPRTVEKFYNIKNILLDKGEVVQKHKGLYSYYLVIKYKGDLFHKPVSESEYNLYSVPSGSLKTGLKFFLSSVSGNTKDKIEIIKGKLKKFISSHDSKIKSIKIIPRKNKAKKMVKELGDVAKLIKDDGLDYVLEFPGKIFKRIDKKQIKIL